MAAIEGIGAGVSTKVMIVEDSPTQALRARIALEAQGFDVLLVNRSRDAVPVARDQRPDIVLSEVRMLGLDGYQLAAAFREDRELARVPVILQSGSMVDREEARTLALEHGAIDYMEKGLPADALADALNEAIARAAR